VLRVFARPGDRENSEKEGCSVVFQPACEPPAAGLPDFVLKNEFVS